MPSAVMGGAGITSYARALHVTGSASGVGNVSTGETDLATYSMPAGTLSSDGKALRITAFLTTANNANNKAIRIYFGATVISTPQNNGNGNGQVATTGLVIRTGASAQIAWVRGATTAGSSENANSNTVTTPAADTTGAITIKVTGQGAASNDILLRGFVVELLN